MSLASGVWRLASIIWHLAERSVENVSRRRRRSTQKIFPADSADLYADSAAGSKIPEMNNLGLASSVWHLASGIYYLASG